MGFFEPVPPPPPELPQQAPPEWASPPVNVLGSAVAIDLVLVRTADVAIQVRNVLAYPMGVAFVLDVRQRSGGRAGFEDPTGQHPYFRREPDELLRFGVQFADGGKATTVRDARWPGPGEDPPSPRLSQHMGGGGGTGRWEMGFWLWPLPPPGPLAFVVEWPGRGIAETRVEVDAELLRRAAGQAQVLWEPQLPQEGPWTMIHRQSEIAGAAPDDG